MDQALHYGSVFFNAISPCWAEFVGALLMVLTNNLISIKGTQKETFRLLTFAFYTIILKDIATVFFELIPVLDPNINLPRFVRPLTELSLVSLTTAFFVAGALRNIRMYFSSILLVILLTLLLAGVSIGLSYSETLWTMGAYLSSIYMLTGFFIAGASFYVSSASRQNKAVRAVGNGFIVLGICYGYQLFDLIANIQQIILLCYTITIVLSLVAQVQLLNLEAGKLQYRLDLEKKGKKEVWEVSPFPIVISRLRDDKIIYVNPAARQMLLLPEEGDIEYPLSSFFAQPEQKDNLLEKLHKSPIVRSFEAEVHHPEKNNNFWIDLMTRTTDFDEEVVLFTTFKDITTQRKTAEILKEQASTDPLTGLYNRRQFEILAYQALQTARRYGSPYSVGMIDIDFFKKVNDTYGHEAGDAVLKGLADVLKKTLRKSDVVARYGGEEFVIFFSNTPPEGSKIGMEHVREAVEKMEISADGQVIHISVSGGISDSQSGNLNTLIKHADEALYASKENGRNQVTLYQDLRNSEKEEEDQE
ncbi:MAG: sensor domain-containing diguanylate cyclase [Alphaproteobacteria bacterium]|nr:sensor domain-containing diguanylate cyclase [Alphaproteobacteria bacterium]